MNRTQIKIKVQDPLLFYYVTYRWNYMPYWRGKTMK